LSVSSTKNLAIILIALIAGVAVGYGVGVSAPRGEDPRIKQLENQIANLQSQITNLENQISSLQNQLQGKENEISTLQDQLSQKEQEIASLQEEINRLQALVPPYTKGEWNELKVFTGFTDKTTELFLVLSSELKIKWEVTAGAYADLDLWLYNEKGEYIEAWLDLEEEPKGEVYVHGLKPGNYYLEISASNVQYKIIVEAWIPD